jgi:hypothetical protein
MPDPAPDPLFPPIIGTPIMLSDTIGSVPSNRVAVVAAPLTRQPSSTTSTIIRNGIGGSIAAVLGRLCAEQWVVPATKGIFSAADPATLAELTGYLPLALSGVFIGAWAGIGTYARDVAFAVGSRWAKVIGSIAS